MGLVGAEERHEVPRRKVTAVVPPGARPGETQLSVDLGSTHDLLVRVPAEARPGDKLLLCQGDGSSWTCSIVRRLPAADKEQVPVVLEPREGPQEKRITLLVPPRAAPGESKLSVRMDDGSQLLLRVPDAARPGDVLELRREAPGDDEGLAAADAWQCKLVRDRVARGRHDDDLEHVAQLRPLRASPLGADAACRNLIAAVRACGGAVSAKLMRGCAPPLGIPGLLAAEPIEEGEELCRIPSRLQISTRTVELVAPEFMRAVQAEDELPELRRRETAQCACLAQLLLRAEDRAAGSAPLQGGEPEPADDLVALDVWRSYADGLLNEDFASHPYRRAAASPEEIRMALEPSMEAEFFTEMAKDIHKTYQTLTAKCSRALPGPWPDFTLFFRARLCMLTRVFQAIDDSTLVPVVDLFNHAPSMNHGVSWRWNAQEQAMVATARRAHAKGEELFCSYGLRSNLLLYRTYGFTHSPDVEPAWTYMVWPEHVHPIYKMFLPESERCKQVVLDSKRMEDSLCEAMNEVCKYGRDAAEFLRLICARCMWLYEHDEGLQPVLAALARARRTDPTSSAWWAELGQEERGLADEEFTRIKMCEYLCLVAHMDAVEYAEGKLPEHQCLQGTEHLRSIFSDALTMLRQEKAFCLKHVTKELDD